MNPLGPEEKKLLLEIAVSKRYPVVCLQMFSSKESSLCTTVLPNVHLTEEKEAMASIKERGARLKSLEQAGYIRLDFRPAIYVAGDYAPYARSSVYRQLCRMAEESRKKPDFLFDIPHIRKGRAVVTDAGREAVLAQL